MIDPPDGFEWHDALYRARTAKQSAIKRPVNIYEVHAGSWKRHEDGSYLNYEELAAELVPYVFGHRLMLSSRARLNDYTPEAILAQVLEETPAPAMTERTL